MTGEGIVIASGVVSDENDLNHFRPMLTAAKENLEAIGAGSLGVLVADAGYYTDDNATPREGDPEILIATKKDRDARCERSDRSAPRGPIPRSLTVKQCMERKLSTKRGQNLYKKRGQTVEPIFGQHRQSGFNGFKRRGLEACDEEWAFKNACHNLMKVYRSGKRPCPSCLSRRGGTRDGCIPTPCHVRMLRLRLRGRPISH